MRSILSFSLALASLFCLPSTIAHAAQLQFQPGQTASYIYTQNYENNGLYFGPSSETDGFSFGETNSTNAKGSMEFDITILSLNPETLSYPIEVELTVRSLSFETITAGELNYTVSYDSQQLISPGNQQIAKIFQRLINTPLKFIVNDNYHVEETTGRLRKLETKLMEETCWGFFAPIINFEDLLSQIFHLAGQDLNTSNSYPICSRYSLLGKYFAELFSVINEKDSGAYKISQNDSDTIKGTWSGNLITHFNDYCTVFNDTWSSFSSTSGDSDTYPSSTSGDSDSSDTTSFSWSDSSTDSTSDDSWGSYSSTSGDSDLSYRYSSDWSDDTSDEGIFDAYVVMNINMDVLWDANNPLKQYRHGIFHANGNTDNPQFHFSVDVEQLLQEVSIGKGIE